MYKLSLAIEDWLPASLNKGLRTHWRKQRSRGKAWDSYIAAETHRKRPGKPLERAAITIVRHAHRTLDFDGLVGSLKPVVDALVECRILKDDSWGILGPWRVDQKFRPKAEGTLLEILVEELPLDPPVPG